MKTKKETVKLDWKKFEPMFGTWADKIKPFFDSGKMDDIYAVLKAEATKGKKIAPSSTNTFRCFKETDYHDLKCVIVCQDPYAKFVGDSPIASGVAMDCSLSARTQPTLQQFYNGIEAELYNGLELNYINDYDLCYLSAQGVLLMNTAFTVEKDKPNSHMKIWHEFATFLFKEVIGPTGVPVLFLGKEAGKFSTLVEKTNPVFLASHPVSASYSGKIWNTEGVFTKINKCIWDSNEETISWLHIEPPY